MSELPLEQWREWSKTDDRFEKFVLSDIRQMIGEIDRLRKDNEQLRYDINRYTAGPYGY